MPFTKPSASHCSFYKAIRQPLLFQARSTVLVAQTSSNPNTNDYANLVVNERLAQNYAQLLVTQPVMTEVVRQTGITLSPDALKSMRAQMRSSP